MKLAAIAITVGGLELCGELKSALPDIDIYLTEKLADSREKMAADLAADIKVLDSSLKARMEELMAEYDGLICFMALGIVVRIISPWLQHKREDPAVVTVDENGSYVISTLSGHLGGANTLTKKVADILAARPVITTATDVSNKPSLDLLAAELDCALVPFARVKKASAALVNESKLNIFYKNREYKQALLQATASENTAGNFAGENIEFISLAEKSPGGKTSAKIEAKPGFSIIFTNHKFSGLNLQAEDTGDIVQMVPHNIIIGIGARRNIKAKKIIAALQNVRQELNLRRESLKSLATVDIKQQEPGLKRAAEAMNLPLKIVKREEIAQEMENSSYNYSFSEFVKDKIGVGGVCEPAAMLTAKKGKILQPKKSHDGVTTAVVEENFTW